MTNDPPAPALDFAVTAPAPLSESLTAPPPEGRPRYEPPTVEQAAEFARREFGVPTGAWGGEVSFRRAAEVFHKFYLDPVVDVVRGYHDAMCYSNELGYSGASAEQVMRAQEYEIAELRKQLADKTATIQSRMRTQRGDPYVPTLRDARALQDACEGELEGVSPTTEAACRILVYVATGRLPRQDEGLKPGSFPPVDLARVRRLVDERVNDSTRDTHTVRRLWNVQPSVQELLLAEIVPAVQAVL
jgi:hypothetical protein